MPAYRGYKRNVPLGELYSIEKRLDNVTTGTTEEDTDSGKLRKDYKEAFDDWALQIGRLQAAAAGDDANEAATRAAVAEAAYRDSRDRLTDDMGWPGKTTE